MKQNGERLRCVSCGAALAVSGHGHLSPGSWFLMTARCARMLRGQRRRCGQHYGVLVVAGLAPVPVFGDSFEVVERRGKLFRLEIEAVAASEG